MEFEVLQGTVHYLWVGGGSISISEYKEIVEQKTSIFTEVDSFDWIAFLPMADSSGSYTHYSGRLNTGKMRIRGVMARRGDTSQYVRRMLQELFDLLGEARNGQRS